MNELDEFADRMATEYKCPGPDEAPSVWAETIIERCERLQQFCHECADAIMKGEGKRAARFVDSIHGISEEIVEDANGVILADSRTRQIIKKLNEEVKKMEAKDE